MFPALDADLTLSPAGEQTTVLAVAGVHRLPGQVAAGPDPDLVRCLAEVTIRSFIARLACALTHPAGTAVPADRTRPASPPELTIGPGTCKPPVPPAAPRPPRRQGKSPGRVGLWPVACAPALEWTGC